MGAQVPTVSQTTVARQVGDGKDGGIYTRRVVIPEYTLYTVIKYKLYAHPTNRVYSMYKYLNESTII